jgi:DNA-binding CsgD family transcriptional regulator
MPRMREPQPHPLEVALRPLLARVRGEVVHGEPAPDDIAVEWLGDVVFHVRLPAVLTGEEPPRPDTDLSDGLTRLIAAVEDELGSPLATLSRAQKQQAVRLLEDRGAFEMRRSAETVAEALGLSRFTVYNYLNRIREDGAAGRDRPAPAGTSA